MLRLAALLLAWCAAGAAFAHTRSESHSAWTIDGPVVHMSFTVSDLEAARVLPRGGRPSDEDLIAYLAPREGVLAGGKPCRTWVAPRAVAAASGFRRVEFGYRCPDARDLVLASSAFVDLVPTHVDFAQIQTADGEFTEQLFTRDQRTLPLAGTGSENRLIDAGFLDFVRMGVMHIFTGIDHMSFLVGLVLISRKLRDLGFVVTGFTLGHSLTLALAVTGVVRPHGQYIDALVALTIALIGIENIAVATRRPGLLALWTGGVLLALAVLRWFGIGLLPPLLLAGAALFAANYLMISGHLAQAGRVRLVVTLVFGLIHGFGFAADLLESRLPVDKLAKLLLGFNLGVEIGQLSLVLALTAAVALLARARLTVPRAITVDVAASTLVGLGTFWFVGRSF